VQLTYVVDAHELYQKDYLYESSITQTASKHWQEFADTVVSKVGKPSFVLDIGGNDGTLLSKFGDAKKLNVEPCEEVAVLSDAKGIATINDFFDYPSVYKIVEKGLSPDLIVMTNVFAHIDDLDRVMVLINQVLKEKGTFVFESPYLGDFLEGGEYDTVYHQHLSYLSLKPLIPFFEKHGFEIFDVDRVAIHGGCFRVYIARKGEKEIKPTVNEIVEKEDFTIEKLFKFSDMAQESRRKLFDFVYSEWKKGKTFCVVSTPAKGQTLLNYTGIGRFISFATDKSNLKQGRYTPGTFIKIYSDRKLIEEQPDYAILLAWNFKDEIIRNCKDYKGKWILPLTSEVL
jgi:SAM-dependent methyltransferase